MIFSPIEHFIESTGVKKKERKPRGCVLFALSQTHRTGGHTCPEVPVTLAHQGHPASSRPVHRAPAKARPPDWQQLRGPAAPSCGNVLGPTLRLPVANASVRNNVTKECLGAVK